MRYSRAITAAALFLVSGCSTIQNVFAGGTPDPFAGADARAELVNAEGEVVGRAGLDSTPSGVLIRLRLDGLPPGRHALHIHETGACEAPDFESAGGHYNPFGREHGFRDAAGPHAGDLPNIVVPPSGELQLEVLADEVTLREGRAALFDADGSALVIHAGADDYRTDPAGDAGDRLACGVVRG